VRLVASRHDACGAETRVRLPGAVPSRAVRRVVCDRCAEPYQPARVEDVVARPARKRSIPWRRLTLPVAALAVLGGLLLLQDGADSDSGGSTTDPPPVATAAAAGPERSDERVPRRPGDARLISESTFQLALPAGWERTVPSGGATFAAAAPGGDADVMLWVERDPNLDFAAFEQRSLDQLESLAGSAETVARNAGPTPGTTSITIAPSSVPDGAPNYEVLLRASENGAYWYYLATTSEPGAAAEAIAGVKLVQGSFIPRGGDR
jgi:hypothetical protein